MATWHQQKAGQPAPHATDWQVIVDPPNQFRHGQLFKSEVEARQYCAATPHSYVIPPHGLPTYTVEVVARVTPDNRHFCTLTIKRDDGQEPIVRHETNRFKTFPAGQRAYAAAAAAIRRYARDRNLRPFQIKAHEWNGSTFERTFMLPPFRWQK